VDDKKGNDEERAPLEYLPRGPRVSSYATATTTTLINTTTITNNLLREIRRERTLEFYMEPLGSI